LPQERNGAIWVHAVSVGEVLAGLPLAKRLKEDFPERPLVISTTTITGQALAKERMPFADAVIYFPLDWAFCARRALAAVRPSLVVILETEIWPNFLRESARRGVPAIFVSGRISDRSFRSLAGVAEHRGILSAAISSECTGKGRRFLDAERKRRRAHQATGGRRQKKCRSAEI